MREIKFRAWDRNTNTMRYPDGKPASESNGALIDWFEDEDLMQYTGLKDKNGKEIYEGDVVGWWSCEYLGKTRNHEEHDDGCKWEAGEVAYNDEHANFCIEQYGYLYTVPYNRPLEVIGNIYENPELIKN